jgi:serine/threonine protein kinase
MSLPDLTAFCQTLVRSKLLSESEVSDLRKQARADNADSFAAWLVEQGKLTRYQADSLLRGKVRFFLGDYKLLELVGTGRMAGVYRATHKLGMPVAVKVLPPSKAKQPDCLARFQREAELALQLEHPHVVRTYHAGTADDLHYIAMEYLEGETLEEHLASKGKLPPADAVRIIQQALLGL